MKVSFINVGYGEAILIESSSGKESFNMIIDGGSNMDSEYENNYTGRIKLLDYLIKADIDHIDIMVISHIHEDHLCGLLNAAKYFRPKELWQSIPKNIYKKLNDFPNFRITNPDRIKFAVSLNDWVKLQTLVEESGGKVRFLKAGDRIPLLENLDVQILGPQEERTEELGKLIEGLFESENENDFLRKLEELDIRMNNYSLIMKLLCFGRKILLPGDTNMYGYRNIFETELRADVFKIGHHGQKDGADRAILKKINPQIMVCCASSDRRFGSAATELIKAAMDEKIEIFYSDCPLVEEIQENLPAHNAVVFDIDESALNVEYHSLNN